MKKQKKKKQKKNKNNKRMLQHAHYLGGVQTPHHNKLDVHEWKQKTKQNKKKLTIGLLYAVKYQKKEKVVHFIEEKSVLLLEQI